MSLNLFNLICFLIIISSFLVIISQNALHSILFLVFCFFFSAMTIFLLENEFLALFFLIIYLGAIIILFLFVVMMLDIKHNKLKINQLHLPTGVILGFFSFFYLKNCLINTFITPYYQISPYLETNKNFYVNWQSVLEQSSDVFILSGVIYKTFVFQLLMAGILLYTTTIGVVFLTSNKSKSRYLVKNRQFLTKQLSRTKVL